LIIFGEEKTMADSTSNLKLENTANGPRLVGTTGPDLIFIAPGNKANSTGGIWGGKGSDTIVASSDPIDKLYGNEGNDSLIGGPGSDAIFGGKGIDVIAGNEGNDYLSGGKGNDILFGDAGNDILNGGAGNDALSGAIGNDYLIGGPGIDTLLGGTGADTFVLDTTQLSDYISGVDLILDFNPAEGDRIALTPPLSPGSIDTGFRIDYTKSGSVNNIVANDTVLRVITPQGVFKDLAVVVNTKPSDFNNAFIAADPLITNLKGDQYTFLP
jgi:Ca2+-binding RTX toxin-like protein